MISATAEFELDQDVMDSLIQSVADGANEAGEHIADAARVNLVDHQSKNTGTVGKQSEDTRGETIRDPLIDSIATEEFVGRGFTTVLIGVDEPAARVGWFVEFGHQAIYWGEDPELGDERIQSYPYLRPAFFDNVSRTVHIIGASMGRVL